MKEEKIKVPIDIIDYSTYRQIYNDENVSDEEVMVNYLEFLRENNLIQKPFSTFNEEDTNSNVKLEDKKYFSILMLLEQVLPRYEMVYGKFSYSSSELTDKEKCLELLKYLKCICKVKSTKDIFRHNPMKNKYN